MEKIQSRMGCSGKSFTVMTFRYFHAQRLDETSRVAVFLSLCGGLKTSDRVALITSGSLYPFQNKSSCSMPVTPKVHTIMCVYEACYKHGC